MLREIFSFEYLDLAAILAFIAAIVAMFAKTITAYWTENTKRKIYIARHTTETFEKNKKIIPMFKFYIYNLYIEYMMLKNCNYKKNTSEKCKKNCKQNLYNKIFCLKIRNNPNILFFMYHHEKNMEIPENELAKAENEYNDIKEKILQSITAFSKFVETEGFPLLPARYTKKMSKLYYDLLFLLQIKDSSQELDVCIRLHNLELVKKYLQNM